MSDQLSGLPGDAAESNNGMEPSLADAAASAGSIEIIRAMITNVSSQAALATSGLSSRSPALPHLKKVAATAHRLMSLLDTSTRSIGDKDRQNGEYRSITGAEPIRQVSSDTVKEVNDALADLLTQTLVAHVKLPSQHPAQVQIAQISRTADSITKLMRRLLASLA